MYAIACSPVDGVDRGRTIPALSEVREALIFMLAAEDISEAFPLRHDSAVWITARPIQIANNISALFLMSVQV